MRPAKQLEIEVDPNKFDLRTHVWDAQGALVRKNLYTNHCVEGRNYFERPIKSGNLWYANNQPAGRVDYIKGPDGKTIKKIDEQAAHTVFTPELEGDEALLYALEQEKNRSTALEQELAAIKADRVAAITAATPAAAAPLFAVAPALTTVSKKEKA